MEPFWQMVNDATVNEVLVVCFTFLIAAVLLRN